MTLRHEVLICAYVSNIIHILCIDVSCYQGVGTLVLKENSSVQGSFEYDTCICNLCNDFFVDN